MLRLALRGGRYNDQHGAGLFGLNLKCYRSNRSRNVGFRPAPAPNRQKPCGHGRRDGTGAKGGRFLPGAKRGNSSTPARLVAPANTAREPILTRQLAVHTVDGERPESGRPGVARRPLLACWRRGPFWPLFAPLQQPVLQRRGFPSALALDRQKPDGYGCRDGTGAKGGRFLPGAKRGNSSTPARLVAPANTAREPIFDKEVGGSYR